MSPAGGFILILVWAIRLTSCFIHRGNRRNQGPVINHTSAGFNAQATAALMNHAAVRPQMMMRMRGNVALIDSAYHVVPYHALNGAPRNFRLIPGLAPGNLHMPPAAGGPVIQFPGALPVPPAAGPVLHIPGVGGGLTIAEQIVGERAVDAESRDSQRIVRVSLF